MTYDSVGNLTADNYTNPAAIGALGVMEYDADNHLTAAMGGSYKYRYNGDGKRVRRITAQGEFWMVYGIGGELVAEYNASSGIPLATAPSKEFGYRNGQMLIIAEGSNPKWMIQDHLGSTRMEIGLSGAANVVTRHDYLPFGEELAGAMRSGNGYGSASTTKQKFAEYERDIETGLDYAQARYYSSIQGRFTSPDKFFVDQEEGDPQSWNLYSYVRNNPLAFTDPTGEYKVEADGTIIGSYNGEVLEGLVWSSKLQIWSLPGESGVSEVHSYTNDYFLTSAEIRQFRMQRSIDEINEMEYDLGGGGLIKVGVKKTAVLIFPNLFRIGGDRANLAANLIKAGLPRLANSAAHHIVPFGAKRAATAQRILRNFDVDINSIENGVWLPNNVNSVVQGVLHKGRHTDEYIDAVTDMLNAATKREEVIAVLN